MASTTSKVSIFLTGATGYIGGSVLQRLLDHPKRADFEITALVRDAGKAKRLEAEFGVKTTVGSLQDLDKLSALAEQAHVVIQTAFNNDLDAINAILRGLKARHDKTGDVPLLIHTSGGGLLLDDARGAHASAPVYSDLDAATLAALPPTAFNRAVDLAVLGADAAGHARACIVSPAYIYGRARGALADAGLANAHNGATRLLVGSAVRAGHVGVLGPGASVWADVHVEDNADLYIRLFDALLSEPAKVSHGAYFFTENGELSMGEALKTIADTLFALGRISTPELVQHSPEEMAKYYGVEIFVRVIFSNSRCKAERGRRELGWAPKYTPKDFLEALRDEVETIVKEEDAKGSS